MFRDDQHRVELDAVAHRDADLAAQVLELAAWGIEGLGDVAALRDRSDRLEMGGDVAAGLDGGLDTVAGSGGRCERECGSENGKAAKTHTSPSLKRRVWHAARSGSSYRN